MSDSPTKEERCNCPHGSYGVKHSGACYEAQIELWKGRAERICNLVLRLNADEGLSADALSGLQRLASAAMGNRS
jgi:hypothetical protein